MASVTDEDAVRVIGDEDSDGVGADLILDDDPADGGAAGVPETAEPDGLLLEDEEVSQATSLFGELRRLSAQDIPKIEQGTLSTRAVLGLAPEADLATLNDDWVRSQIKKFREKLVRLEQNDDDFQLARTRVSPYADWLRKIESLSEAPDAALRLRTIIEDEARASAFNELKPHVAFTLKEKVLHWRDHERFLRRAIEVGLSAEDLEELYRPHEPFERESREQSERSTQPRWEPHKELPVADEWTGDISALHAAMLADFSTAQEIANAPHDRAWSLFDYLERNKAVEPTKQAALAALKAAHAAESPPLAPWLFLWKTGYRTFHVGGKGHRPTKDALRVESLSALLELFESRAVLPALGSALEAGLLEHWLNEVCQVSPGLLEHVSRTRTAAGEKTNSARPGFVRAELVRILWQLGLRGLPLWDKAGHGLVAPAVKDLVETADRHLPSIQWHAEAGTLADWLDSLDGKLAAQARAAAGLRLEVKAGDEAGAWSAQLPTYRLLWSAGYARLPLGPMADQLKGNVQGVDSAAHLSTVLDGGAGASVLPWLDWGLRLGYCEAWAADALKDEPLRKAAASIRADDRGLKGLRFGQRAGMTSYVVAGVRVNTPEEFAQVPLQVSDLSEMWEHIREQVPQARWANQLKVVQALDAVRSDAELPDGSRPLVACLRLGLRALPLQPGSKFLLQSVADLGRALDAPNGRAALHRLLDGRVLEEWAARHVQGGRDKVRAVRTRQWPEGLAPELSPDAAAHTLGHRVVHAAPGKQAANFEALRHLASEYLHETCGSPASRARIRQALSDGAIPGAPAQLGQCPEEELQGRFSSQYRALVFSWRVLGLKQLPLDDRWISSCDELVTVMANGRGRDAARVLAAEGVLTEWAASAQGLTLHPSLPRRIDKEFPELALELGEPPPALSLDVTGYPPKMMEGERATLVCTLHNRDPLRDAAVIVRASVSGPGNVPGPMKLLLAAGKSDRFQIPFQSSQGTAGHTTVKVEVLAAHPAKPRPVGVSRTYSVEVGFPWGRFARPALGWMVALPLVAILMRTVLAWTVSSRFFDGMFVLPTVPDSASTAAALSGLFLFLALERGWIALTQRALWAHRDLDTFETLSSGKVGLFVAGGLGTVASIFAAAQGKPGGCWSFLLGAGAGWACVRLARRDVPAALAIYAWVVASDWIGARLVALLRAMDGAALVAGNALASSSWDFHDRMLAGWAVGGALLGGGHGLAAGLRAVNREGRGDAVQVAWLCGSLLVLWWAL